MGKRDNGKKERETKQKICGHPNERKNDNTIMLVERPMIVGGDRECSTSLIILKFVKVKAITESFFKT